MPKVHRANSSSEVRDSLSRADKLCRDRGLRLTRNRREVLEILLQENRAMGAYELREELEAASGRRIQPPTIYRALYFLVRQRLVARLASRNAFVVMGPRLSQKGIFLTCENCGSSFKADNFLFEKLVQQNASDPSFRISLQGIELIGTCARCLAGAKRAAPLRTRG
jgi:Fur family transcriptional regulator, zinc uptake regulator